MGIADIVERARNRGKEKKLLLKRMDEQMKAEEILEGRKKSANERELERFWKEKREEDIKIQLDMARKERENDIRFNHNPLDTPNITNHTEWEVLKEKNLFGNNKNMFVGQKSVLRSNSNLLKNNMRLLR